MVQKIRGTLMLDYPITPEASEWKKKLERNVPIPDARGRHGNWDHLIVAFIDGKSLLMPHKRANSLGVRARGLGCVAVIRRDDDENSRIWIEGVENITPHQTHTRTRKKRKRK